MTAVLPDVWYALLGLFLALYVVLDGFTLGVGILSLLMRNPAKRKTLMATLTTVWDANETWLVVFGGALFGAFPAMYGVVLHGLYIPVMLMLLALIFRSIAFEYQHDHETARVWRTGFAFGSLTAALMQGYALGAVLSGLPLRNGEFAGGVWDWLSPFGTLTACGVVAGYALLGASYLVIKTEGSLQAHSRHLARVCAWLTVGFGTMVSVWTPLRFDYIATRWFDWPGTLWLAILPGGALFCFMGLLRALRGRGDYAPFLYSTGVFLTSLTGLGVSLYPYLIPTNLSIAAAAAPPNTLRFMLAGIGGLIPLMIAYNAYQYRVFRGKVAAAGDAPERDGGRP